MAMSGTDNGCFVWANEVSILVNFIATDCRFDNGNQGTGDAAARGFHLNVSTSSLIRFDSCHLYWRYPGTRTTCLLSVGSAAQFIFVNSFLDYSGSSTETWAIMEIYGCNATVADSTCFTPKKARFCWKIGSPEVVIEGCTISEYRTGIYTRAPTVRVYISHTLFLGNEYRAIETTFPMEMFLSHCQFIEEVWGSITDAFIVLPTDAVTTISYCCFKIVNPSKWPVTFTEPGPATLIIGPGNCIPLSESEWISPNGASNSVLERSLISDSEWNSMFNCTNCTAVDERDCVPLTVGNQ
jgi:hypothetical protein